MKTSNKLIFILALAFLFSLTSLMIYAKSNLVTWDQTYSEFPNYTKELLAEYTTNVLRLDADYNFYLDDESTGVRVEAPEQIIGSIRVSDEESLIFYTEGMKDIPYAKIDVYIGVQGKNNLEIIARNNARVRGKELAFDTLQLNTDDNTSLNLVLTLDQLNLTAGDNVTLDMKGFCKNTNLKTSGNASINAREFNTDNLVVDANGNSSINFNETKTISGRVNDNSSFSAFNQEANGGLIQTGNASINIK